MKDPKTKRKAVEGSITKAGAGYESETVEDYDVYVTVSGVPMPLQVWEKKTEKDLEQMENEARQRVSETTGVSPEKIQVSGSVPLKEMGRISRRSRLDEIYGILKSVESKEGKLTQMMHKANLSLRRLERHFPILIERNLIEELNKEKKTYRATEERSL